ncbi:MULTISPECIES: streptomycin biosynthesis protein [Actinosynnema]|uniref:streptomycin biosynthesis protein n=1 Tax=Actinosynnema TaxID=40566 RepID=UPI0020A334D2|nr:streptomycin biosynthesis protein [Actinosynnema pretiosum]
MSGEALESALVPVDRIEVADSPRVGGENPEHTRLLAEVGAPLPPILVHRSTMRVIDGVHRLRAATLRGQVMIAVQYFDGDEESAYLLAVRSNLRHGLPLSLNDRRAAAQRVLARRPEWSDRVIASLVGLSPDTVAAVRCRALDQDAEPGARVGRDGRVRPVDPSQGRRRAEAVLAERPDASLREIAREAGIAVATARDVRERVRRGLDAVPGSCGRADREGRPAPRGAIPVQTRRTTLTDLTSTLGSLKKDPSLRFTEDGRKLLRWLDFHLLSLDADNLVTSAVPPHCAPLVAELSRQYARLWQDFAKAVEHRAHQAVSHTDHEEKP